MIFDQKSQDIIAQMLAAGCGFSITFSDVPSDEFSEGFRWEADFFMRLKNGRFDNYKSGESRSASEAIRLAKYYFDNNIKS